MKVGSIDSYLIVVSGLLLNLMYHRLRCFIGCQRFVRNCIIFDNHFMIMMIRFVAVFFIIIADDCGVFNRYR